MESTDTNELKIYKDIIETTEMPNASSIIELINDKSDSISLSDSQTDNAIIKQLLRDLESANTTIADLESKIEIQNTESECNTITNDDSTSQLVEPTQCSNLNSELTEQLKNAGSLLLGYKGKIRRLESQVNLKSKTITDISDKLSKCNESYSVSLKDNKSLSTKLESLNNELSRLSRINESVKSKNLELSNKVAQLNDEIDSSSLELSRVTENLTRSHSSEIKRLESKMSKLVDEYEMKLSDQSTIHSSEITELNDKLVKANESLSRISKSSKLIESARVKEQSSYTNELSQVKSKYLQMRSAQSGFTESLIRGRLPSNYTVGDIDSVINSLQSDKLKTNNLPLVSPLIESISRSSDNADPELNATKSFIEMTMSTMNK